MLWRNSVSCQCCGKDPVNFITFLIFSPFLFSWAEHPLTAPNSYLMRAPVALQGWTLAGWSLQGLDFHLPPEACILLTLRIFRGFLIKEAIQADNKDSNGLSIPRSVIQPNVCSNSNYIMVYCPPSIYFFLYMFIRDSGWGSYYILATIGQGSGYTLDWSPIHHRANKETTICTHINTYGQFIVTS